MLSWVKLGRVKLSWVKLSWVKRSWVKLSWVMLSWVKLSWVKLSWVQPRTPDMAKGQIGSSPWEVWDGTSRKTILLTCPWLMGVCFAVAQHPPLACFGNSFIYPTQLAQMTYIQY